jgi:transcriptional regulator GlxA family with amidase domain
VDILVFPGFQIMDACGPIAAFEMPARESDPAPYDIHVVSLTGGAVKSSAGIAIETEPFNKGALDTLLVVGGLGTYGPATCRRTLAYVRGAAQRARRVVSVCSGAYVLAVAGLLDGKRATTHWERAQDFQRRFPRVKVQADRIYIRDGAVWTSAGVTAGIDLSLALIAEDLGEAVAKRAAQQMVVFHRRPGGQSQFSALLELSPNSDRIARALSFAREHLHETLSVQRLAEAACLSSRQFSRAFFQETGQTPAKAVERLRVEAARADVEAASLPLDQIAARTGFLDPERMRRAFLRAFGAPPQALRRAARAQRGGEIGPGAELKDRPPSRNVEANH